MTKQLVTFATLDDAMLAGYMQAEISGSSYAPIDCRQLSDQDRAAFQAGYEAALAGDICPTAS